MIVDIINKILMVIFFVASLNTVRHLYYFIQTILYTDQEISVKYKLSNKSLILLGISIAYILTAIFTGIKL